MHPTVPSVLAIVVTHEGRKWLTDCLVALNAQSYPELDILVVDDATSNARVKPQLRRVAKRHLTSRRWGFMRTPRPLGFGGAINFALSRVRTDVDFLLFIHDDAVLNRRAVERLARRLLTDEATAIVGPKIVSWDDPARLEEVGMAADRFGYPYKGLEEGEIDRGQHDTPSEVFFVTSTCMLVRHSVFRQMRGWDARMRAFSEDLDLCWRARVAGHAVRVEPRAVARHAIALATGQRASPFTPTRYFIRRNRFRAVTKNASALRLVVLVPQLVLLTFAEMLAFIVLRQPREILNLGRALLWNVARLPQTLAERRRVQRRRTVTDHRLMSLSVKETTRARSYVMAQAERLEEAWGRRTEVIAERSTQARAAGARLQGAAGIGIAVAVLAVCLGLRHFLLDPPASVGELVPFPSSGTALWREWLSPWQDTGLGQGGAAPPAFALLGVFSIVSFGAAGVAQKLMIVGLGAIALAGAYRLVADFTDRAGRLVTGIVYVAGGVGYAGMRGGHLGALVFGAAAPHVLLQLIRLLGWARPPRFSSGRSIAVVALGAAVSATLVPGSLLLYGGAALLLGGARAVVAPGRRVPSGILRCLAGLVVAFGLLLPWSLTWFDPGGPLDRLTSDGTWRVFASAFGSGGFGASLLGQVPQGPVFFGLGLVLLGIIAVVVGAGPRRRMALGLWLLIGATGWLVTLIGAGSVRPFVASPTEAGVIASAAWAALAGLAVGSFRMDLPRRNVSSTHVLTIGGLAAALLLGLAGTVPAVWHGAWNPGGGSDTVKPQVLSGLKSLLEAESSGGGSLRVLWVGRAFSPGPPSAARPLEDHFVTGPSGEELSDLFARDSGRGEFDLHRSIASIEEGTTDRGGSLLGAFNIGYVVLQPGPGAGRWLAQRDLAVIRSEPGYLVLQDPAHVERAGVYNRFPPYLKALEDNDPSLSTGTFSIARLAALRRSASSYEARNVSGPGVAFLAEDANPGWHASLQGHPLERIDAGWGNGFRVTSGPPGTLSISYPSSGGHTLWLIVIALAWIVVVGAAFSGQPRRGRRTRS